jgi:hypothetical protein
MRQQPFSEVTCYGALALRRLGAVARARQLLRKLLEHARNLRRTAAGVDYFATSLPTLLLFDDNLQRRQDTTALYLEAQARLGLGETDKARALLRTVLRRDPSHGSATDLLRLARTFRRPAQPEPKFSTRSRRPAKCIRDFVARSFGCIEKE